MKNLILLTILLLIIPFISFSQNADSAAYFLQKGNEAKDSRLFLVASQQYRKSIQLNADNPDAQRQLGLVSVEMRKYPEAILAFAEVTKKKADDPHQGSCKIGIEY